MTEIKIERKRRTRIPWIIGALALALVLWTLTRHRAARENVDAGVVDTRGAVLTDSMPRSDSGTQE